MNESELRAHVEELDALAEHVPASKLGERLVSVLEGYLKDRGGVPYARLTRAFRFAPIYPGGDSRLLLRSLDASQGETVEASPGGKYAGGEQGVTLKSREASPGNLAEPGLRQEPEEEPKRCNRCGRPEGDGPGEVQFGKHWKTADGKARTCTECIIYYSNTA